jgi:hypothetical protein
MAEPHDDESRASRAYRDLPREEPPARLDDAIRAAARREARSHPAPLVVPTGRRKWYFPLAAAAVIVLAVAVTSQVEREQPDPMQAAAPQAKEEPTPERQAAPKVQQAAKPERRLRAQAESEARPSREDFSRDRLARNEAPRSMAAPEAALAKQASPEAALERIAELRRQGKDAEADRALVEFRKGYPGYRIAPAMLEKVERKK